jgi:protein-S-isoprenylcysteine O-methyltransferase Ste14
MSNYLFKFVCGVLFFVAIIFFCPVLVLAQEGSGDTSEPGWVLAYALVLICLAGAVALLTVRSAHRNDTVFTESELAAKREEEIKKLTKH